MRAAYDLYAGARGFTPAEFEAAAQEIAGVPVREFFRRSVESTDELDYSEALDWFGLRFRQPAANGGKSWIGADTRVDGGRLIVSRIPRDTPAFEAGLSVDDEIIAIADLRVRADQLTQRLEYYRPGTRVPILVARREKLVRLELTLGAEPPKKWQLEIRPDATIEQAHHLESWLRE